MLAKNFGLLFKRQFWTNKINFLKKVLHEIKGHCFIFEKLIFAKIFLNYVMKKITHSECAFKKY